MINAQPGIPDRDGVLLESPFVGPGMRERARLVYFPSRLSLVPKHAGSTLPPDVVLVHTSPPSTAPSRWASRSTSCPRRSRRPAPAAAWSSPRSTGTMPVHLRRRGPVGGRYRLLRRGGRSAAVAWAADVLETCGHRRPGRRARGGRRDAAARGSARSRTRCSRRSTRRRGLSIWSEMFSDGVLGLSRRGRARRRPAAHRLVRVRQRGTLRVGGPEPGRSHAAHRDHQRAGADRPAARG